MSWGAGARLIFLPFSAFNKNPSRNTHKFKFKANLKQFWKNRSH